MRKTLTLIVVAKNQDEIAAFPLENVRDSVDELILLANPGAHFGGMGAIGNHALDESRCDVVGMVHADTSFGCGALETFTLAAMKFGVSGIVGRSMDGNYVWSKETPTATEVSTLDSCAVFIDRATATRFDTKTFDGFHCCVEDFCLAAGKRGLSVYVPPAKADHIGATYLNIPWQADYRKYRALLDAKWSAVPFLTT